MNLHFNNYTNYFSLNVAWKIYYLRSNMPTLEMHYTIYIVHSYVTHWTTYKKLEVGLIKVCTVHKIHKIIIKQSDPYTYEILQRAHYNCSHIYLRTRLKK